MSFDKRYDERFEKVIKPAIEDTKILGFQLKAYRVDNSKTGDSILTDIVDGIAHSRIVLADISVMDKGQKTKIPFRNGNVMYEVGIALASRQPSEVLIIRDDREKFLFDVSTIPHMTIDFENHNIAVGQLREAIIDRVKETKLTTDARITISARTITRQESYVLDSLANLKTNEVADLTKEGLNQLSNPTALAVSSLIRKGAIESHPVKNNPVVYYSLTNFGRAIRDAFNQRKADYGSSKEENGSVT